MSTADLELESGPSRHELARQAVAAGDYRLAIELLVAQSGPAKSGEYYALLGDAYFLTGQYGPAEDTWRAALARLPDHGELVAKSERAAANVVMGLPIEDPQTQLFLERFAREWYLSGPRPGTGAVAPDDPDSTWLGRLGDLPASLTGDLVSRL